MLLREPFTANLKILGGSLRLRTPIPICANFNFTHRRIQSEYRKHGVGALSPKPKGGRNHQNLSLADEQAFVADLATKAEGGQIIEISQIYRAYEEKVVCQIYSSGRINSYMLSWYHGKISILLVLSIETYVIF